MTHSPAIIDFMYSFIFTHKHSPHAQPRTHTNNHTCAHTYTRTGTRAHTTGSFAVNCRAEIWRTHVTATHCSALQLTAPHCNSLQQMSVLQQGAFQRTAAPKSGELFCNCPTLVLLPLFSSPPHTLLLYLPRHNHLPEIALFQHQCRFCLQSKFGDRKSVV